MMKRAFMALFGVFAGKQTFLNIVYLLAGFACASMDLILLSVSAGLVFGLVGIPMWAASSLPLNWTSTAKAVAVALGGILIIPASMLLWFFPALLEQRLAAWLLDVHFSVRAFWTAEAGLPPAILKYIISGAAWRRFLFAVLRIPLGFVSFLAVMIVIAAAAALLSLPAVYLAGFRDLIVGPWRIDSLGESLLVFLAALILAPIALHVLNLLSRFSGGLARLCLRDA